MIVSSPSNRTAQTRNYRQNYWNHSFTTLCGQNVLGRYSKVKMSITKVQFETITDRGGDGLSLRTLLNVSNSTQIMKRYGGTDTSGEGERERSRAPYLESLHTAPQSVWHALCRQSSGTAPWACRLSGLARVSCHAGSTWTCGRELLNHRAGFVLHWQKWLCVTEVKTN